MSDAAPDFRPYARELIAAVDPHLAVPAYLLTLDEAAEAFDGWNRIGDAAGLGGPDLCVALRDVLDARGEWQGYGFAAAVDPSGGIIDAASIVLHEYGHFLDGHAKHDLLRRHKRCQPARKVATPERVPLVLADDGPPPWAGHGPSWVRLCLHLGWRSHVAKHVIYHDLLCDPTLYGLAGGRAYFDALDGEAERLIGLPMLEVAKLEPPTTYTDFALADVARAESRLRAAQAA